ncbi:MAG: hypothetical protein RQ751_03380 [Longimicrobiales bacterium]|nr:hypothetical protein [Longimicrobiales bacterium]
MSGSDRTPVGRTLREGVLLGTLGYVTVAVFYAAFDFLAARGTLYTVDLLGKAFFRGLRDPAVLQLPATPDLTALFLYNLLHLALSLAIGLIVAWLLARAERGPRHALTSLGVMVVGFVVTVLAAGLLTEPIRPLLPWWSIVWANAAAVLVAGTAVVWRRPGVLRTLFGGSGPPPA